MASGPWIFASEDGKRLDVRHEVVGRIVDDKVALFQSTESSQTLSGTVQKTICVVYGECAVRLIARTDAELGIVYEVESKVGRPVDGCLPLFPHVGQLVRLSTGDAIPLGEQPRGNWYGNMLRSLSEHYGFNFTTPWYKLDRNVKKILLYGTGNKKLEMQYSSERWSGTYTGGWEGTVSNLMRRYRQTKSNHIIPE